MHLLFTTSLLVSGLASAKTPDADTLNLSQANVVVQEALEEGRVVLQIGDLKLNLEYADTHEKRALGLMYRRSLCTDCGMLFKFESSRIGSIWMKNTFIPLDLAYINEDGKIVDIEQLQAHNLTPVRSSSLVRYALEMNKGWFAKHDIRVGDSVNLLP